MRSCADVIKVNLGFETCSFNFHLQNCPIWLITSSQPRYGPLRLSVLCTFHRPCEYSLHPKLTHTSFFMILEVNRLSIFMHLLFPLTYVKSIFHLFWSVMSSIYIHICSSSCFCFLSCHLISRIDGKSRFEFGSLIASPSAPPDTSPNIITPMSSSYSRSNSQARRREGSSVSYELSAR